MWINTYLFIYFIAVTVTGSIDEARPLVSEPSVGIPAVALNGASAANGMVGLLDQWLCMDKLKSDDLIWSDRLALYLVMKLEGEKKN